MPLNSSISLNANAYDDDNDMELLEKLELQVLEDPLDTITKKEYYKNIETKNFVGCFIASKARCNKLKR